MAGVYDFPVEKGADNPITLVYKSSASVPIDLSGYSAYLSLKDALTDAVTVLDLSSEPNSYGIPGNLAFSGSTLTKSGGTSFITAGFEVGDFVTLSSCEDGANDGTWELTAVTADVLTVDGTFTTNADDDTASLVVGRGPAIVLNSSPGYVEITFYAEALTDLFVRWYYYDLILVGPDAQKLKILKGRVRINPGVTQVP